MIIMLNGEEIQWDASASNTLGDLLEDFVNKRFFKDEFIASLEINGASVPDNGLEAVKGKLLADISSLGFKTDTFRKVSMNALESIGEYLDGLASMVNVSSNKFRTEPEKEANNYFVTCIDGLQTFVGILDRVKTLNGLDFKGMTFNSKPISEKEAELLNVLNSILEVQAKKDWVSMADLLEFELSPRIAEWKDILSVVLEALKTKS